MIKVSSISVYVKYCFSSKNRVIISSINKKGLGRLTIREAVGLLQVGNINRNRNGIISKHEAMLDSSQQPKVIPVNVLA